MFHAVSWRMGGLLALSFLSILRWEQKEHIKQTQGLTSAGPSSEALFVKQYHRRVRLFWWTGQVHYGPLVLGPKKTRLFYWRIWRRTKGWNYCCTGAGSRSRSLRFLLIEASRFWTSTPEIHEPARPWGWHSKRRNSDSAIEVTCTK